MNEPVSVAITREVIEVLAVLNGWPPKVIHEL